MPKRVLIVDDSPIIRNVIKLYLPSDSYEIVEAADADRALRVIRLMPVDLVIADVNMPGTDGLTFVRKLREDPMPSLRSLPVILMTGDDSGDIRERAAAAGANAFARKPVSSASLLEAVGKLIG